MIRIVSILSKLFKTVGLLAVRLNLAELRCKNRKKCRINGIPLFKALTVYQWPTVQCLAMRWHSNKKELFTHSDSRPSACFILCTPCKCT